MITEKIQWLQEQRAAGRFKCNDESEDNDLSTLLNQMMLEAKVEPVAPLQKGETIEKIMGMISPEIPHQFSHTETSCIITPAMKLSIRIYDIFEDQLNQYKKLLRQAFDFYRYRPFPHNTNFNDWLTAKKDLADKKLAVHKSDTLDSFFNSYNPEIEIEVSITMHDYANWKNGDYKGTMHHIVPNIMQIMKKHAIKFARYCYVNQWTYNDSENGTYSRVVKNTQIKSGEDLYDKFNTESKNGI